MYYDFITETENDTNTNELVMCQVRDWADSLSRIFCGAHSVVGKQFLIFLMIYWSC